VYIVLPRNESLFENHLVDDNQMNHTEEAGEVVIFNSSEYDGLIRGVSFRKCSRFPDERGSFSEVFRGEWAQGCNYLSEIQLNLSRSIKGALRGLHFHRKQFDWWIPVHGTIQVALADLRADSATFRKSLEFTFSADDSVSVLIPPGVAHGFLALEDAGLMYAVDRYYDGSDEQGVIWNDPELEIPWKTNTPILSERDSNNPTVAGLEMTGLLP
jgi:dTDP-4-dehydrorhamnose 3,5-epimerase